MNPPVQDGAITHEHLPKPETASGLEQHVTVHDICQAYRVQRPTVYSWERRGLLRSIRLGSALRFRLTNVQAFIESSRQAQQRRQPPRNLLRFAGQYRRRGGAR